MRTLFRLAAGFCIGLSLLQSPGRAATIAVVEPESDGKAALINVEGDFNLGDDKTFTKLALQFDTAVILFSSNGGNLSAGLAIGKAIRLRQYSTIVMPGTICASACALAWLGGVKRYMPDGAQIGFHAAYNDDNGQLQESGIANALVGSYLNQIGLPENAVAYITHAAPQSIQWLTPNDARQNGIYLETVAAMPPIAASETPVTTPLPPTNDIKVAAGIDLFGNDLAGMPLRKLGWNGCVAACAAHSSCKAFTYNSKSDTCFLKSNADLAVHYEPATSGYLDALASQIRDSQLRILQRTDVVGGDYAHFNGGTMETCVRRCDEDPKCRAFTFIAKKTQCWLKSQAGSTIPKLGVVSGLR